MDSDALSTTPLWPMVAYFVLVLILVAGMLTISWLLGQRHNDKTTNVPYESGIVSTGSARLKLSVSFYLMAMFFVIFDLESVFIYAWSITLIESGWAGYVEMLIFIGVLMAALIYLWREGALEWGGRSQISKIRKQ